MKAVRILKNNLIESVKGVFRNFSLSMASISCITITLILVGFSILLSYNVNNFTDSIEKDLTIVVFLERHATKADIDEVDKRLKLMDNISEIKFNSREKVKAAMQKDSEVFKNILADYTEETNPLQDTYLVKVEDINQIGITANLIKKIDKVNLVKYGEGSVEELVKIFNMVEKVTFIAVIALIVVTAYLISNTIKITIQSRKREIEIRRLVGASNSYIRQPFFFEGIILGFLGSILPIVICTAGYAYLYDKLGGKVFTAIIKLVNPSVVALPVIGMILAIGIVVGSFGSYRAVRKYLKI